MTKTTQPLSQHKYETYQGCLRQKTVQLNGANGKNCDMITPFDGYFCHATTNFYHVMPTSFTLS